MIKLQKFLVCVNAATVLAHLAVAVNQEETTDMVLWFCLASVWVYITCVNYKNLQETIEIEESIKKITK
jgi:hypothetical protein